MSSQSENRTEGENTEIEERPFTYIDNGVVEPFLDFKVDNFYPNGISGQGRTNRNYFCFFLSHMHEDHLKGLSRMSGPGFNVPDEEWDHGKIYTSTTSKILLLLRFPHLRPYVEELDLYKVHNIRGRTV